MNVERLMQMVLRLLFRHGIRFLNRGRKSDPRLAETAKKLRMGRRIERF